MPALLPQMMAGTAGGGGGVPFQPTGQAGGMEFLDILKLISGGGAPAPASTPGAQPDPRQLFQLMLLQQLSQSPFYQGQPVRGAGSQILQALLPFLTAGVQSKFLGQEEMRRAEERAKEERFQAGTMRLESLKDESKRLAEEIRFNETELGKTLRARARRKGGAAKEERERVNAIELEKLRQRGRITAKGVPQARAPSTRDALLEELVGKMKPDQKDAFLKQLFLHSDLLSLLLSGGAALGGTPGGGLGAPGGSPATMSDEELKRQFNAP